VEDIKYGWPYKDIVDSSKFNQYLYEISNLNKQIEIYGFLPWSDLTDYEVGSCCLGTDGKIYQAVQNTGPSTTAYNPVNDTNHTYWNLGFARLPDNNTWTGTNTFVTQSVSDSSTKAATTAYVKGCVPKNVGSTYKPVYTNSSGIITASNANVGGSGQPVYMASGTITACTVEEVICITNMTMNANGSYSKTYSNGWLEQGGIASSVPANGSSTITLSKSFANSNYSVSLTYRTTSGITAGGGDLSYNPSTGSFVLFNGQDQALDVCWKAVGIGA
jgi:hypothetical protein